MDHSQAHTSKSMGSVPSRAVPVLKSREKQQRQPGKQRDDDDVLAQLQCIVRQVRSTQKLEVRPAQDEREVLLSRAKPKLSSSTIKSSLFPCGHSDLNPSRSDERGDYDCGPGWPRDFEVRRIHFVHLLKSLFISEVDLDTHHISR